MDCSFTLQHYEQICQKIIQNGYKTIFFDEDFRKSEKIIFMRHDIDQSLEQALKIATIEKRHNIRSTYFIWLRSPFYNIFEKSYTDMILRIKELGHEIGLHFDANAYSIKEIGDFNAYVEKETEIIQAFFNISITSISMHRPSIWILNQDIQLKNYINTYSNKYLHQIKYLSDSRMLWKEGCICKIIDSNQYDHLHILTHPLWWTESSMDFEKRMMHLIKEKLMKLDHDLSQNMSIYEKLW